MSQNNIRVWKVMINGAVEIELPDLASLDTITRQLPQGCYTTFRTFDHSERVLGLRAHLQRLYQPAAGQKIASTALAGRLRESLAELLRAYPDEARVRLIMTAEGQVYIAIEPLKPLPAEIYSQGVRVISSRLERNNPRLKSTNFISASQDVRKEIANSKAFEALLVRQGSILEGVTSNFFYVSEGKLGTARNGILLGVTRRTVIHVARRRGLEIVYKPLRLEQVSGLTESFLTSSSRGIVPIVQVDDVTVGEGGPGPITKQLIHAYAEYVNQVAEKI